MDTAKFWTLTFLIHGLITEYEGATHWVVTEKGMIQSHIGSPLDLRRPYDLISLLDQEKRWSEIQTVLHDLMSRKSTIEEKWASLQGNSGMDSKMTIKNSDCLVDGKLLSTLDLYSNIATNGSERVKVDLNAAGREETEGREYRVPDCVKYSKVEISSLDYEHFPSLHSDDNVTLPVEEKLEKLMPVNSVQLFGHEIHEELVKNASSWVHYNLGALYWRIKGDGPKAVNCSKRALHFVPKEFRDIPLHNLAGILHKARRSKEAVLLLLTAIEHAPKQALHYLALGNVYSALGDYNSSIAYYDKFLELDPNHNGVMAIKKATLCFSKLENHLIDFQENVLGFLQGILSDLHDFHSLQQHWLRLSKRLMWEHSSYDDEPGGIHEEIHDAVLNKRSSTGGSQRCVQKTSSDNTKQPVITCDFVDSTQTAPPAAGAGGAGAGSGGGATAGGATTADFDTLNLQNLFQYVETETQRINEKMAKTNRLNINAGQSSGQNGGNMLPVSYPKYPNTISTSGDMYFDAGGWPLESECNKWNLPVYDKEDLRLPVFLPPENKGYQVGKILSQAIGMAEDSEHPLPWYPPVCDNSNGFGEKYIQQTDRLSAANNEAKTSQFLREHFLKYVNNGKADEAEIGQRIISAIKKKSAPNWVLSTLASLYWRVRGNTKKALDCLDLAFHAAPKEQSDVILVSIGSILQQLGLAQQATKYANLAFKLNCVEPSTNFLLAILQYEDNPLLAMYHMKNVLRVEPEFYGGHAEFLLKVWGCRIKIGGYNNPKKALPVEKNTNNNAADEMCSSSNKESFKGQGVICSANGEECKTASIQCFHARNLEESNGIVHERSKNGGGKHSLVSALETSSETAGESKRETPFQMRIFLGDEQTTSGATPLGDFYALSDDPVPEAMLQVYDKSGTYPLSSSACKEILEADVLRFSSMWQSITARNVDIGPYLKPLPKPAKKDAVKPYCSDASSNPTSTFLNQLTSAMLRNKLPEAPDKSLSEWLRIMSGDQKASIDELGAKIGMALQENTTSWLLSTAAALYWRIMGSSEEAIVCLRLALTYVPDNMRDVPLISLASLLQRIGFNGDALEVAYMAVKSHPTIVLNHFTVASILTSMGDLEEAISFYRSALALDDNFEPARNRLQAILCTLLFDETGTLRNSKDLTGN